MFIYLKKASYARGLFPHSLWLIFLSMLACCQQMDETKTTPLLSWGIGMEGFPLSIENLNQATNEIGISPQIIQFYMQWEEKGSNDLLTTLKSIANKGMVPCMTWEPMIVKEQKETMILFEEITSGKHDSYLHSIAKQVIQWGRPLIIRFAHEMNLNRYHWGGTAKQFNEQTPKRYIEVYRYIVDFFRKQGTNQLMWAFCPNVDSVPNEPWNQASLYYPGDSYVDILGMDGYNWDIDVNIAKAKKQSWTKPNLSFENLFSPLHQELLKVAPTKPLMVFETATVDRSGQGKAQWIKEAFETAKKWHLLALIWFQVNKEDDWRINARDDKEYIEIIESATNSLENWMELKKNEKKDGL